MWSLRLPYLELFEIFFRSNNFYYNVTLPFSFRNELEYVREELKQKRDEIKCKLDKSEENVCCI